ncbi:cysteine protease LapG [Samsonia erythrinae]|uniref:Putative transglutaminase-like cysteine proteinase n=1 Tax=Samsonia erythrinae TaxID=160434 RepID=A0A4R3VIP4_9GAMM|nr:transglutaminase-like cysteine peptidase [Samsonia erythrinae]TCV04241.1 putative transglutaminase-like cysteine proteinase [Samsonia erythrinae]
MRHLRFKLSCYRLVFISCLLFLLAGSLRADWDFVTINQRSEQLYGPATPASRHRIEAWQKLLIAARTQDEKTQLESVNAFFNDRLLFRDDSVIWDREDYWATPIEALRKGAADCEDYALAKYFTLRQLGVSAEKLRITYVKALRLNKAHMVVTFYPSPTAIPLVLDNLTDKIQPATQRNDLIPVYAFNGDGLWLPGSSGNNKRVGDSKRLSRWQDVLIKMRAEGFSIKE